MNQKYGNVISTSNFILTNSNKKSLSNEKLTHHIPEELNSEFILVEGKNGTYMTLRLINNYNEDDVVTLQTYYKNKHWYVFFLTLANESEKLDRKHTYFMIKKSHKEVENMGALNNIPLVSMDENVTIILQNKFKGENEQENLGAYTQNMTYRDLLEVQRGPQQWLINLNFEKLVDHRPNIDFVPFIYQEKSSVKTHRFCVFDIHKMRVVKHT